ncbi:MAG: hypothetical protein OXC68_00015 [Aestuariivita sp.]|nr:hypothetical protein [Aestuariivita sp.]
MKRGRPVYCRDPADWERIRARAETVGVSVSEFVMTCALQDRTPAPYTPLVLTPQEQRDLVRNVETVRERLEALFHSRTDGDPSVEEALQILYELYADDRPFEPESTE